MLPFAYKPPKMIPVLPYILRKNISLVQLLAGSKANTSMINICLYVYSRSQKVGNSIASILRVTYSLNPKP